MSGSGSKPAAPRPASHKRAGEEIPPQGITSVPPQPVAPKIPQRPTEGIILNKALALQVEAGKIALSALERRVGDDVWAGREPSREDLAWLESGLDRVFAKLAQDVRRIDERGLVARRAVQAALDSTRTTIRRLEQRATDATNEAGGLAAKLRDLDAAHAGTLRELAELRADHARRQQDTTEVHLQHREELREATAQHHALQRDLDGASAMLEKGRARHEKEGGEIARMKVLMKDYKIENMYISCALRRWHWLSGAGWAVAFATIALGVTIGWLG
jgi:hypothetical protein